MPERRKDRRRGSTLARAGEYVVDEIRNVSNGGARSARQLLAKGLHRAGAALMPSTTTSTRKPRRRRSSTRGSGSRSGSARRSGSRSARKATARKASRSRSGRARGARSRR